MVAVMIVAFEGFPRILERSALRPGRWFVAADGLRPILCFTTDIIEGGDTIALTFGAPKVELVDFAHVGLRELAGPFATVEDEIIFAPGLGEKTMLAAPTRRAFASGSLLRLRNGDLGIGFALKGGQAAIVSFATGERCEGFDLVFERWTLSVRRGAEQSLIGAFRPLGSYADERRRG